MNFNLRPNTLDTYASVAASAPMTLRHPDAARADLQLNAWFFSLGGTAARISDALFSSKTARRGFSVGESPLPCGAGVGRAESILIPLAMSSHAFACLLF